jgi:hypothetical protein
MLGFCPPCWGALKAPQQGDSKNTRCKLALRARFAWRTNPKGPGGVRGPPTTLRCRAINANEYNNTVSHGSTTLAQYVQGLSMD